MIGAVRRVCIEQMMSVGLRVYLLDQCFGCREFGTSFKLWGGVAFAVRHLSRSDLSDLVISSLARVFSGKFENLRLFSFWKFCFVNFLSIFWGCICPFPSPVEGGLLIVARVWPPALFGFCSAYFAGIFGLAFPLPQCHFAVGFSVSNLDIGCPCDRLCCVTVRDPMWVSYPIFGISESTSISSFWL